MKWGAEFPMVGSVKIRARTIVRIVSITAIVNGIGNNCLVSKINLPENDIKTKNEFFSYIYTLCKPDTKLDILFNY